MQITRTNGQEILLALTIKDTASVLHALTNMIDNLKVEIRKMSEQHVLLVDADEKLNALVRFNQQNDERMFSSISDGHRDLQSLIQSREAYLASIVDEVDRLSRWRTEIYEIVDEIDKGE